MSMSSPPTHKSKSCFQNWRGPEYQYFWMKPTLFDLSVIYSLIHSLVRGFAIASTSYAKLVIFNVKLNVYLIIKYVYLIFPKTKMNLIGLSAAVMRSLLQNLWYGKIAASWSNTAATPLKFKASKSNPSLYNHKYNHKYNFMLSILGRVKIKFIA